jgi:hypothetical protein
MMVEVPVPIVGPDVTGVVPIVGMGTGLVGGGRFVPTGVGLIIGFVIVLVPVPVSGVVTGVVGVVTTGVGVVTTGAGVVTPGVGVVTVEIGVVTNVAFDTTTVGAVGVEPSHAAPKSANTTRALIRII